MEISTKENIIGKEINNNNGNHRKTTLIESSSDL